MVDISAIAGLAQSIKTIGDIAKAMLGLRDAHLIRDRANELNEVVSDALKRAVEAVTSTMAIQQELAAALQREGELKEQIAQLVDWSREQVELFACPSCRAEIRISRKVQL
jgi:hypothetical protein